MAKTLPIRFLIIKKILDDVEKAKIPHRWCQVRSPLKISEDMSEDVSAEGGREGEDTEPDLEASEGSEWIRIDDLADRPKKIVIFHRQNNPNYYHQNEYLPAVKESIKGVNYKYLLTDTKTDDVNVIITFNIQNTKNEWNGIAQVGFQIDALRSASDSLNFKKLPLYWLRVPGYLKTIIRMNQINH